MTRMDADEIMPPPHFDRYLTAHLRTRTGRVNEVRIVDISIAGCLIERRAIVLNPGDATLVKLPGLSNLRATVLWVEEYLAGIEFEELLHDAVFENLQRSFMSAES
jgi:hypothetical protein